MLNVADPKLYKKMWRFYKVKLIKLLFDATKGGVVNINANAPYL